MEPEVHYRIHKNKLPVPTLSQINPVRALTWRSILIISSHLLLSLPSDLFPSGYPAKTLYAALLSPCVLRAPPLSFLSIWSPEQYLVWCIDQ
jgi:hypothetical protein